MEIFLLFLLGTAIWVTVYTIHEAQLRRLAESWAAANGLHLVSCEKSWFRRGPYWLKWNSQIIYRVVVIDKSGRQRCAWLRCGGIFRSDNVEVEWED